ncbi:plasmalemma vesicle-associated protein [Rhinophrynus dorsalis]
MDSSYSMAKFGMESKDILRSNQKNCWFYFKYFFLFSSIIQFLIILGLVLFMVYGNTHTGTETMLEAVQTRNTKLTADLKNLQAALGAANSKLNSTEKDKNSCNAQLQGKKNELDAMNKTLQIKDMALKQQQWQLSPAKYDACMQRLYNLNVSCFVEKIMMRQEKSDLTRDFGNYKANCTRNMDLMRTRERQANSEKDQCQIKIIDLRNEKVDLNSQIENFRSTCTSIDTKFKFELQRLKENFEQAIRRNIPDTIMTSYQYQDQLDNIRRACQPLSDQTTRIIDSSLMRLRQDIVTISQENSQLKASNNRIDSDLSKCKQEKEDTLEKKNKELISIQSNCDLQAKKNFEEKNSLRADNDEMAKKLKETTDSLTRTNSQLVGKLEELQRCQKIGK